MGGNEQAVVDITRMLDGHGIDLLTASPGMLKAIELAIAQELKRRSGWAWHPVFIVGPEYGTKVKFDDIEVALAYFCRVTREDVNGRLSASRAVGDGMRVERVMLLSPAVFDWRMEQREESGVGERSSGSSTPPRESERA